MLEARWAQQPGAIEELAPKIPDAPPLPLGLGGGMISEISDQDSGWYKVDCCTESDMEHPCSSGVFCSQGECPCDCEAAGSQCQHSSNKNRLQSLD